MFEHERLSVPGCFRKGENSDVLQNITGLINEIDKAIHCFVRRHAYGVEEVQASGIQKYSGCKGTSFQRSSVVPQVIDYVIMEFLW
jgi:hypothetical protein